MALPPKVPRCMLPCPRLPNRYSRTYTWRSTHPILQSSFPSFPASCRATSRTQSASLSKPSPHPSQPHLSSPETTASLQTLLEALPPCLYRHFFYASTPPHAPCRTTTRNRLHRGALHIHTRSPQSHGAFVPQTGARILPPYPSARPPESFASRLRDEIRSTGTWGGAVGGTRCGMCRGGGHVLGTGGTSVKVIYGW
jgi:hypothetical protein